MPRPHEIAREQGDGSRSRIEDQKTGDLWEHKDQRAETETTFWPQDIDELNVSERRKRELRSALRRQEGENQGEHYQQDRRMRRDANRDEWKRRMVSIYCAQVDATRYQQNRSRHLVMDVLDFSSFGSYTKEQCILGVINVVAREDGRFIEDEDSFRRLMEAEEIDQGSMRNIRKLVRQRL